MSSSDTSEIDAAVLAVLTGDATLATLAPGGVWFDVVGGANVTRYVLVTQLAHEDQAMLRGDAWERVLYAVKFVGLDSEGGDAKAAAARIHTLLHDTRYPVTGFFLMQSSRLERIRYTERDDVTEGSWQHRGGQYAVWAAPAVEVALEAPLEESAA